MCGVFKAKCFIYSVGRKFSTNLKILMSLQLRTDVRKTVLKTEISFSLVLGCSQQPMYLKGL